MQDPSVSVVTDVPITTDRPTPYMSIVTAERILTHLGVGGFCYARTPYVDTFYYAAAKLGIKVGGKQCFRRGVPMHRITRVK